MKCTWNLFRPHKCMCILTKDLKMEWQYTNTEFIFFLDSNTPLIWLLFSDFCESLAYDFHFYYDANSVLENTSLHNFTMRNHHIPFKNIKSRWHNVGFVACLDPFIFLPFVLSLYWPAYAIRGHIKRLTPCLVQKIPIPQKLPHTTPKSYTMS
jgi:hypothetical protein